MVSPETVIGEEAAVPVMLPGVDVAVYVVIAALPVSVGAVKATETEPPVRSVAVPIVGAPGERGQMPCLAYVCAWHAVQMPDADVAVGTTGVPLMIPPGYFLLIYKFPVQVDGKERVFPGQMIRTAPTPPGPPR